MGPLVIPAPSPARHSVHIEFLTRSKCTLVENRHFTAETRRAQRNDFPIWRGAFRQAQDPEQNRREAAK
jgi:hypothetical protein